MKIEVNGFEFGTNIEVNLNNKINIAWCDNSCNLILNFFEFTKFRKRKNSFQTSNKLVYLGL